MIDVAYKLWVSLCSLTSATAGIGAGAVYYNDGNHFMTVVNWLLALVMVTFFVVFATFHERVAE